MKGSFFPFGCLVLVTWHVHKWNLFHFFGRFVQKVGVFCFSDSVVQKTTRQKDGSCNITSDSQHLYEFFKKQFFSTNTYEKYNVSKEYCIARHDDKMCFSTNCRYNIRLKRDLKELLQKSDAFSFNYQHVDSLYTHPK